MIGINEFTINIHWLFKLLFNFYFLVENMLYSLKYKYMYKKAYLNVKVIS